MLEIEKGGLVSRPNPNAVVNDKNSPDSKPIPDYVQALAHSLFAQRPIVVHESIGDRFRKRVHPRIRAWRGAP